MHRDEIEKMLRMSRAYAAEQLPWFAPTLFAARLVLTSACPSLAAVDEGLRVYFHPDLTSQLLESVKDPAAGLRQLAWVWVHEISHVLREHAGRAREMNAEPQRWNIAADLEINDGSWEDLVPPQTFKIVTPYGFRLSPGKLAEYYYKNLKGMPQNQPAPQLQPSVAGMRGKKRAKQTGPARFQAPSSNHPQFPEHNEGSGVHGVPQPWELDEDHAESPAVAELERKRLSKQTAEELLAQKQRGVIPAGWLRWAEELHKGKINWRELLKRRVRSALARDAGQRTDYTWQRPHRRAGVYRPFLRPALSSEMNPRAACVVDTSGSMGEGELSQVLAEVRAVLESLRLPIVVIPCDAVAYEPIHVFTSSDFIRLRSGLRGGGGTDMRAGITAALQLQPPPETIIVLTDGYTPFPSEPPRTPVIFGILRVHPNQEICRPPIPPWRDENVVVIPMAECV